VSFSILRQVPLADVDTRSVLKRRMHSKRIRVFHIMNLRIICQILIFTMTFVIAEQTEKLGTQRKKKCPGKYHDITSTELKLFPCFIKHQVIKTYRGVKAYLQ
jgi:hypothetical protein